MFRALKFCIGAACLALAGCASYPKDDVAQMRFVEAAGVKTHVETWGSGEPVLLIHGASSHIGTWRPTIVPMLSQTYLLAAYDRPGMGYTTDRPKGSDTLDLQAKVLVRRVNVGEQDTLRVGRLHPQTVKRVRDDRAPRFVGSRVEAR